MTTHLHAEPPGQYVRRAIFNPKKVSVTLAAKLLGVGRPALSNFLNGKAAVSKDMAARLERAFGISAQKLLDLQAAYDAAGATSKALSSETRAYMPPFLGIKAIEIEAWASNITARTRFSVLLRTLVHSTGIGLTQVDFPGNDDAERPGWDGFVNASEGTPWIPEGQSGWEFGTNQDPKAKADGDYHTRTKSTTKEERANSTFIFVTPRRWAGKQKWQDARRLEGRWREVRAFDASDLEQWLEQSIPAQAWFADETNRPAANGVHSIEREWAEWANVCNPPLSAAFFDTSIRSETKKIIDRLSLSPSGPTIIAADSTAEALAFLAQVFSQGNTEVAAYRDRIVVLHEPGVLPRLAQGNSGFIAVATTPETERELGPLASRLHSIVIHPRNAVNVEPHVVLEPLNDEAFRTGLELMAKTRDGIERLAHESGRSLTVLRRRLSTVPAIRNPEWATQPQTAQRLVPFLLAGAWDSARPSDQTILSLLAPDSSYSALEKDFHSLTGCQDPPVWSVGTYRGVVSKIDLLFAIRNAVTAIDVKTYFQVAQLVLSEDDPCLDLPDKDRWKAGLFGKTREISPALRQGISETLVLLAVYGNKLFQSTLGLNVEDYAATLVRSLLTPLSTRLLEVHKDDLAIYAEAAPHEFLRILESDLNSAPSASIGLMRPADPGIFSQCPRSGLLWALEGLAWSPGTFLRTVLILARLSEVKIDDNWHNKPIASLGSIFRAWMPQTAAHLDQRIKVIELLADKHPAVAWQICVEQFDGRHSVGHYNYKPRWRNDAHGFGEPDVLAGHTFHRRSIEMALQWKRHDQKTLSDLVETIYGMSGEQQTTVWNLISQWAEAGASDNEKASVREKIRVTVMSRRGAIRNDKHDSGEALIEAASAAYRELEPTNLFDKHHWLFRQDWVEESADEINDDEFDIPKRELRIAGLRIAALREILIKHGVDGIIKIAEKGTVPGRIGFLMTSIYSARELVDFILKVLPEGTETWSRKNLVYGALHAFEGPDPREGTLLRLREIVPGSRFVRILQLAPFDSITWRILRELDQAEQNAYWVGVLPPQTSPDDEEDIHGGVMGLLDAKRPRAAFSFVHFKLKKLKPALLFRLMSEVVVTKDEPVGQHKLDSYYITQAFELLNASHEFSMDQLAGLEFAYIDALSRKVGAQEAHGIPNLEIYIEDHPELFVDAVTWLYKRSDGREDPRELKYDTAMVSNRAERGMALLDSLERIPGIPERGPPNVDKLRVWINAVRRSCSVFGRAEAGDRSLGKLLSGAPAGTDGVWPCEPVRQVFEEVQSEAMSRGVVTARYNARGAHFRVEGGDAERGFARQYQSWAQSLEFSHPFIATTILNPLKDIYEQEAVGHDTEYRIQRRLSI